MGQNRPRALCAAVPGNFICRRRDQYDEHAQGSQKNREFENIVHGPISLDPRCAPPYDRLHSDAQPRLRFLMASPMPYNETSAAGRRAPRERHPPPAALTRK